MTSVVIFVFNNHLHCYFGCNEVDVDDQNLTLPGGESGMQESTTYNISVPFSKDNMFELSNNVFELSKTMTNRLTRKGSLLFLLFLPHVMNEFDNFKWKERHMEGR
jgi:hypothetical protein